MIFSLEFKIKMIHCINMITWNQSINGSLNKYKDKNKKIKYIFLFIYLFLFFFFYSYDLYGEIVFENIK